jgi:NTP pyrophosphatase (non-canonical NTP hydrolase)
VGGMEKSPSRFNSCSLHQKNQINNMQELLKYSNEIHDITVSKGFWENGTDRSRGEMVALMVSELSEAIEGHRKNKRVSLKELASFGMAVEQFPEFPSLNFQTNIKDTIEDELADFVIRVLDYVKGFDIPVYERWYRKESKGNFAHDILRLQYYTIQAFHNEVPGRDWGYVLAATREFCKWYDINLEQYIQWKMKYNATRPYKHNKNY